MHDSDFRERRQRLTGHESPLEILHDPFTNKGTAFTAAERDALGLWGLLPPRVNTMEQQTARVMENFRKSADDLQKYLFLVSLQERNETLFYHVLQERLEEMLPIIYTPTVGKACQQYGHILRRPQGVYITADDAGRIPEILEHWGHKDVRVIVVTDGSRILGLGDLGANGMGIPVGKLSLYTAGAGIHPLRCLPVTLDVGTDSTALLDDPLYIGVPRRRLRGAEYDALFEAFIQGVGEVFPNALVQFEDFSNDNALRLLDRYRNRICTFNDDIQGTAAVTAAGIRAALRITGGQLEDQRLLFAGAGSAGFGIAELLVVMMARDGMDPNRARQNIWFMDSKGLVTRNREGLTDRKRIYAVDAPPMAAMADVIRELRPTALIGVSGQGGMFDEKSVRTLAAQTERPIVFALSNPTSKAECTAEQAYTWTEGRAVFASGSPSDPVDYQGRRFVPGQGNNVYIFPGLGLGVVSSRARHVTDEMFLVAADTLAGFTTQADLDLGRVYPPLSDIREISVAIGKAVAEIAYETGLARHKRPTDREACIRQWMWDASYPQFA